MMKSESDLKLFSDYLIDVGCCKICVLRFLDPKIDDFLDVENSLKKVNKKSKSRSFCYFWWVITEKSPDVSWWRFFEETQAQHMCGLPWTFRICRWNRRKSQIKRVTAALRSQEVLVDSLATGVTRPCTTSAVAGAHREVSWEIWCRWEKTKVNTKI